MTWKEIVTDMKELEKEFVNIFRTSSMLGVYVCVSEYVCVCV